MKACRICNNARIDPDLTDDNDLAYCSIGKCEPGYSIMIRTGDGRPLEIIFEQRIYNRWSYIGSYTPAYCPNCGRPLTEYNKSKRVPTTGVNAAPVLSEAIPE